MHTIDEGIFYEDCYPGVTVGAISRPHGLLLIDAPLRTEDIRNWRSVLHSRGGGERMLVALDAHYDRTLGLRMMEAPVITHHKTAAVLKKRTGLFKGQGDESGAEWELCAPLGSRRWLQPDFTFTVQVTLHWGKSEINIEHHPGPMQGAAWVLVPQRKVAFVGDAVFKDQPPFLANADIPAWLETLDVLEEMTRDGFVIIIGRSGTAVQQDVIAQRDFLLRVQDALDELHARKAPPKQARSLAPGLLETLTTPANRRGFYTLRLEYGLEAYYRRHYIKEEKRRK